MESKQQIRLPEPAPPKSNKQLRKIAKWVYRDLFFTSTLEMAGSQKTAILDKMSEGKTGYMKQQDWAFRIMTSIFILILVVIPFLIFNSILDNIGSPEIAPEQLIVNGMIGYAFFQLLVIVYLVIFGMMSLSGMLGAESFKWVSTLPLSRDEIRTVSFLAFFRAFDLPIIAIIITGPLAVVITMFTQGIFFPLLLPLILSIVPSIVNVLVGLWVLIKTSAFMQRKLNEHQKADKKSTLMRTLYMGAYAIGTFSLVFIIQFATPFFFEFAETIWIPDEMIDTIFPILAILPFPTGTVGLMLGTMVPEMFGNVLFLILTIAALGLTFPLCKALYRSILNIFYGATVERSLVPISKETQSVELHEVQIERLTPIKSFLRKDLYALTRDIQMMMFAIMVYILPFVAVFIGFMEGNELGEGFEDTRIMVSMMITIYASMGAVMLNGGFIYMDTGANNLHESLPIVVRDRAYARFLMAIIILIPSAIPASIIMTAMHGDSMYLLIQFPIIASYLMYTILIIVLKSGLFGKLDENYTMNMVSLDKKVLKWIIFYAIVIVLVVGDIVSFMVLMSISETTGIVLNTLIRLGLFGIFMGIAIKMFPRPKLTEM